MIKIKTRKLKDNENSIVLGVDYKTKHSSNYEHLIIINHLIKELLKSKSYTKKELLDIIKIYIEKED